MARAQMFAMITWKRRVSTQGVHGRETREAWMLKDKPWIWSEANLTTKWITTLEDMPDTFDPETTLPSLWREGENDDDDEAALPDPLSKYSEIPWAKAERVKGEQWLTLLHSAVQAEHDRKANDTKLKEDRERQIAEEHKQIKQYLRDLKSVQKNTLSQSARHAKG